MKKSVSMSVLVFSIFLISFLVFLFFSTVNQKPKTSQTKATEPIQFSCIKPLFNETTNKTKFLFFSKPYEDKTLGLYKYDYSKKYYYLIKIFKRDIKKSVEKYTYTVPSNSLISFFILQPDSPVFEYPTDELNFLKTIQKSIRECITLDTRID